MTTVGIDLGGTKCLALLVDDASRVVGSVRLPTPRGGDAIVETLAAAASELVALGGVVEGVGAGVPGLVDSAGVLHSAPNLPGVSRLAVGQRLEERLGLRVVVENDATCAAWGEREAGAGRGRDHAVLVTMGTGIGGGVVLDGRLHHGANGFAGEIGHMVVDAHGPPCPCGQRGCWERFASGSGLGRLGREAAQAGRAPRVVELAGGDPEHVKGEHVTLAAAEGDADAAGVMAEFGQWVAIGLVNLTNILDPEVFVLAGGLVEAGDVLLGPVRSAFTEMLAGAAVRPTVEIVAAERGEQAGAIGAALLARRP